MITQIIPNYHKEVNIELNSSSKCAYQHTTDTILLNLKSLHLNETHFKEDLSKWLGIKLSFKNFIVFCLLHELGHRQRYMKNKFNKELYYVELAGIEGERGTYKFRKHYWEDITEEKLAMNYAKRYFKKYLQNTKG